MPSGAQPQLVSNAQRLKTPGHEIIRDLDFSSKDLRGLNLSNKTFINVNFGHADLSGADCSNSTFIQCQAHNVLCLDTCFNGARFDRLFGTGMELQGGHFVGADFSECTIENPIIYKANFSGAKFSKSQILGINHYDDSREKEFYTEAHDTASEVLLATKFDGAQFRDCQLSGFVSHGSFKGAFLYDVSFEGWFIHCDFSGSELQYTDAARLNIFQSNFDRSKITYCNFRASDVSGCSFVGTSFVQVSFEYASLVETKFIPIRVFEVNFQSARYSNPLEHLTSTKESSSQIETLSEVLRGVNQLSLAGEFEDFVESHKRLTSCEEDTELSVADAMRLLGINPKVPRSSGDYPIYREPEDILRSIAYEHKIITQSRNLSFQDIIKSIELQDGLRRTLADAAGLLSTFTEVDEAAEIFQLMYQSAYVNTAEMKEAYQQVLAGEISPQSALSRLGAVLLEESIESHKELLSSHQNDFIFTFGNAAELMREEHRRIMLSYHPDVYLNPDNFTFLRKAHKAYQLLIQVGIIAKAEASSFRGRNDSFGETLLPPSLPYRAGAE